MEPKILKTDADYRAALRQVDRLMSARSGTREADQLELFTFLLERYEEEHFPIDPPEPIEAIRFRMEQHGLNQADLIPYIGSKSKVSEVLSGKRPLSIEMIRRLHEGLGIPAEVLIRRADSGTGPPVDAALSVSGRMVAEKDVRYVRARKRSPRKRPKNQTSGGTGR